MTIYDLDDILLSPRTHETWMAMLKENLKLLQNKYPDLQAQDIPEEQFRVEYEGSGNGSIFVKIRATEIALNVPANEWEVSHKSKPEST